MPSPLRVAHVIARLNVGGPAAMLEGLVAAASPDVEHVVVAGTPSRDEEAWDAHRRPVGRQVELRALGPDPAPGADLVALAVLQRTLHRLRPDVVHTHTAKAGVLGRLVPGPWARVHTFHGHVLHGYFGPRATAAYVAVERALAHRTDLLLSVGARVRDDLLAAGVGRPRQHRVVLPGVEEPQGPPQPAARRSLDLPVDGVVVGWIGRLTSIKRPDRAVEVVAQLRGLGVDAHLLVAGGGEMLDATRAGAAAAGVPATFTGWTGAVGTVLSASDLILSTSDNEGVPVGLVEAAAAGRPAVATDVGSVHEVVVDGRTGMLASTDPADLARACARLLADGALRDRMAAAGRTRAGGRFSVARMVEDHEAAYREVTRCAP